MEIRILNLKIKKDSSLEDKSFEFEKQLHEQYAINNNDRMSSMITLIVSLIVVLGGYGYMFLHTKMETAIDFGRFSIDTGYEWNMYTIESLLLTASVCFFVIWVIQRFCIYQGTYQRKEQFIVDKIRKRYSFPTAEVLPNGYCFVGKKYSNFVQGIYGELLIVFDLIYFGILLFTMFKVFSMNLQWTFVTKDIFVVFVIVAFLSFLETNLFKLIKYKKYQTMEKEYLNVQDKNVVENSKFSTCYNCLKVFAEILKILLLLGIIIIGYINFLEVKKQDAQISNITKKECVDSISISTSNKEIDVSKSSISIKVDDLNCNDK